MIAKNEDEYVELALQLASDVNALSKLRMSLRELMSKSPVCDGPKFVSGLESTYRSMWHRYCKGDAPALRNLEMLQQHAASEPLSTPATNISVSSEIPPESAKVNGFAQVAPVLTLSCSEENGQVNEAAKNGK